MVWIFEDILRVTYSLYNALGKVGVDRVGADFLKKPVAVQLLFEHHEVRCSIEKFSADKINEETIPPAYVIGDDEQGVTFGNGRVIICAVKVAKIFF
jgi:hypothetical protein